MLSLNSNFIFQLITILVILLTTIQNTHQQEGNKEDSSNRTDINKQKENIMKKEELKTYKQMASESKKIERLSNFYLKAVSKFSDNKLQAILEEEALNLKTITNKSIKNGEVVFEIPSNLTISSFDSYFPYFNISDKLISEYNKEKTVLDEESINLIKLILNVNYVRYSSNKDNINNRIDNDKNGDTSRFFRIYFKNLPMNLEYVPYWDEENIQFANRMRPNSELLNYYKTNLTVFFDFFNKLKSKVREVNKIDSKDVINKIRIFDSLNLINTRAFAISLKGWKVINNLTKKINSEDIEKYGFILIPGADAINHESLHYYSQTYISKISNNNKKIDNNILDPKDLMLSNLEYLNGKVIIKAGRDFNEQEEFLINYDHISGALPLFKRIGYIGLESIINTENSNYSDRPVLRNTVYKHDWIDLSNFNNNAKLICLSLQACKGNPESNNFLYTTYTNSFNNNLLNILRISNIKINITEDNAHTIYNNIENNKLSLEVEGSALSDFLLKHYKSITYATFFRASIEDFLKMYNMSLSKTSFNDIAIFMGYTGFKYSNSYNADNHRRLRETIKLFLLDHHVTVINTKQAFTRLEKVLDDMYLDIKKKYSAKINKKRKNNKN